MGQWDLGEGAAPGLLILAFRLHGWGARSCCSKALQAAEQRAEPPLGAQEEEFPEGCVGVVAGAARAGLWAQGSCWEAAEGLWLSGQGDWLGREGAP